MICIRTKNDDITSNLFMHCEYCGICVQCNELYLGFIYAHVLRLHIIYYGNNHKIPDFYYKYRLKIPNKILLIIISAIVLLITSCIYSANFQFIRQGYLKKSFHSCFIHKHNVKSGELLKKILTLKLLFFIKIYRHAENISKVLNTGFSHFRHVWLLSNCIMQATEGNKRCKLFMLAFQLHISVVCDILASISRW